MAKFSKKETKRLKLEVNIPTLPNMDDDFKNIIIRRKSNKAAVTQMERVLFSDVRKQIDGVI